jgi:hypothetical protein
MPEYKYKYKYQLSLLCRRSDPCYRPSDSQPETSPTLVSGYITCMSHFLYMTLHVIDRKRDISTLRQIISNLQLSSVVVAATSRRAVNL